MSEPEWLSRTIILDIHAEQLVLFGGADGVRDIGLLDSALGRPLNKFGYGEARLAMLAAAYAFGIARNHPFVDGNKRTALASIFVFLGLNKAEFVPSPEEATASIVSLAAGEISEDDLAHWIERNIRTPPIACESDRPDA